MVTKSINYLVIPKKTEDTFNLNYLPLFNQLSEELKRIDHLPISLIGRVNIIKMSVLPKLYIYFRIFWLLHNNPFLKSCLPLYGTIKPHEFVCQCCLTSLVAWSLPTFIIIFCHLSLNMVSNISCSWKRNRIRWSVSMQFRTFTTRWVKLVGKMTKNPVILNSLSIWKSSLLGC